MGRSTSRALHEVTIAQSAAFTKPDLITQEWRLWPDPIKKTGVNADPTTIPCRDIPLLAVIRMPVGALPSLHQLDGMGQGGQDRLQVLANGLGTAG